MSLLVLLGVAAGCTQQPPVKAVASHDRITPSRAATSGNGDAVSAAATGASQEGAVRRVTGTVQETMDAGAYTYVRVDAGSEEIWAASSRFAVAVGDRVVVPLETPMQNFHSPNLKRDFPLIYFTSRISREGETPEPDPAPEQMAPGTHPPSTPVAAMTERIPPADGGITIAHLWANRQSLAGQRVTVRGKVVKFNGGILERNWLHLQDGSGDASKQTHDVAVTTSADASVGDIVTVSGVAAVDKDFGAGYAYPVILEDATLSRK
jgi:hypothetical protein